MRILDQDNDKCIDRVTLYLTESEAVTLQGYLEQLLASPESEHSHASSDDYQKEVTVTVVRENQLHLYSERSRELWQKDK